MCLLIIMKNEDTSSRIVNMFKSYFSLYFLQVIALEEIQESVWLPMDVCGLEHVLIKEVNMTDK